MKVQLRDPNKIMRLSRLGSFHQSKLSFLRSFIREFKDWNYKRNLFDLDKNEDVKFDVVVVFYWVSFSDIDILSFREIVDQLRDNNVNAEVFLNTKKNLGKQLDLANKRELTVAIICGENEFKDNTVTIKNLKGVKGENNQTIPKSNLINEIKKLIWKNP
mgnify:CR=1 FL=1